jgi:hypothetical protein
MDNGKTGRNDAFRRKSRSERSLRKAINDAVLDAVGDDTERALSFDDTQLMKEMIGRKESLAESMMGESGRTISDADRKRATIRATSLLGMPTKKPKPRPDVGAIERGNNAARRTAQDLATQNFEAGGAALVGGQVKLDKNKDGKISGADFRMMEEGGEAKVKKRKKSKKSKGNMCRGGGAALRGTRFSGVK